MDTPSCQFDPTEFLGEPLPGGEFIAMDNAIGKKLLALVAANDAQAKKAA